MENSIIFDNDYREMLDEFADCLDSFDISLNEELTKSERARWKLVLFSLRFVDISSFDNTFPDKASLSKKEKIKYLKYLISKLPEEEKQKIIHNYELNRADSQLRSIRRKAAFAGGSVTGGAATANAITGYELTKIAVGCVTAGATGFGEAIGAAIAGIIFAVAGIALTAIATAGIIGVGAGATTSLVKRKTGKYLVAKSQNAILDELKTIRENINESNETMGANKMIELEESILHKDGIEILVEESVIEQEFETEKTETETSIAQNIDKTDENSKSDNIELRNLPELSRLRDVNTFVGNAMRGLGSMLLAKSAHFSSAYRELLKINLVCGTEYTLGDLFENYSIIKKECGGPDTYCDEHKIEYSKINLDIVNQYRAKIENMANAAYDCLFGDLYDKDVLHKYLPILCFAVY